MPTLDDIKARAALVEARNALSLQSLRRRAILRVQEQTRAMDRARSSVRGGPKMTGGNGLSYGNASRSRLRSQGRTRGGSAQSHLQRWTLDALRRDAQDLDRNNCIARAMVSGSADLVVGCGPTLQVQSDNEDFNDAAERWFRSWWMSKERFDSCGVRNGPASLYEWFRGGCLVDGDVLAVKTSNGTVQTIEAERVKNPAGGLDDENHRGGVQVDASGRVVAYHVAEWFGQMQSFAVPQTVAVPAASAVHLTNPLRFRNGQYRGEPAIAAVVDRLEHLDQLDESVRAAYYVAACTAAFVSSDTPAVDQGLASGEELERSDGSGLTDRVEDFEPGSVKYIGSNKKVFQMTPTHPSANYESLVYNELVKIAADMRLPVVLLLLDFSKLNYSSARSAVVTAFQFVNRARMMLEADGLNPLLRWRLGMALRRGEIAGFGLADLPQNWDSFEWIWPAPPSLDPMVEMQVAELGVRSGLMTRKYAVANRTGADLKDHTDQLEREDKDLKRRGLDFSSGGPNAGQAKETTATERADGTEIAGGSKS